MAYHISKVSIIKQIISLGEEEQSTLQNVVSPGNKSQQWEKGCLREKDGVSPLSEKESFTT